MPFRTKSRGSTGAPLAAVALLLLITPACSGSFEAGQRAFDNEEYDLALDLWMPPAEDGDAQSQFGVGYLYEKGLGVPVDYVEAIHWYRLAAEQGHGSSQLNLGLIYMARHEGVPRDLDRSADWLRMAADQGSAKAQFYLGKMYYRGEGLPRNYDLSFEWLSKAAEQNEPSALNHLGILHSRGLGVDQDVEKAFALIKRSAELGNASAQANLSAQYRHGEGTEQDFIEALKWYTIFRTHDEMQFVRPPMDWVEESMSEEDVAEAERRAEQWLAEHAGPGESGF